VESLEAGVAEVSTPGSPLYRDFLTPAQYGDLYSPAPLEVEAVRSWLTQGGFHTLSVGPGARYVEATANPAAAGRAFKTTIGSFHEAGALLQGPVEDASVPTSLAADVLGVAGLDDVPPSMSPPAAIQTEATETGPATQPPGFVTARPCSAFAGQLVARYEADGTTPLPQFHSGYANSAVSGYTPKQLAAAYGIPQTGLTGKTATVAVLGAYASPTLVADANQYSRNHGEPPFRVDQLQQFPPAEGYRSANHCGSLGWYGEETLDVEAVHALAPDAKVEYYSARSCSDLDLADALDRVVDNDTASIVSNSWGEAESLETSGNIAAYEQAFLQGALEGIGFLFASGDNGNESLTSGTAQPEYPPSDPYVTAVGGTSLAIGPMHHVSWQTAWGTDEYVLSGTSWQPVASDPFIQGSGGGFSTRFGRPDYQRSAIPRGSPPGRAVPDVAMDADPTSGMLVGETQSFPDGVHYGEHRIGGTSLACPLMAAIQALATEAAHGRLGFINSTIYSLARLSTPMFTDITAGQHHGSDVLPVYVNGVDPSDGVLYFLRTFGHDLGLSAGPGWDDATGLGSPTAAYLEAFRR